MLPSLPIPDTILENLQILSQRHELMSITSYDCLHLYQTLGRVVISVMTKNGRSLSEISKGGEVLVASGLGYRTQDGLSRHLGC
jgi:hypothetical protein